jgi:hypothetical protein
MSKRDRDKAMAEAVFGQIVGGHTRSDSYSKTHFPKYRRIQYYRSIRGRRFWNFCYSVGRNFNRKFISWIERPKTEEKRRIVEHKRRKDAKARALRLFNQFEAKGKKV